MIYRIVLSLAETMKKTSKYYWWLQIGGWGTLALILILINVLVWTAG